MQGSRPAHAMADHWRAEARMRESLAGSIESSAGLDAVRLGNAKNLRLEAANLLRMAADLEEEGTGKTH